MSRTRQARFGGRPVVAVALLLLVPIMFGSAPVAKGDDSGLRLIGKLSLPPESKASDVGTGFHLIRIDPVGRRMYLSYPKTNYDTYIREYDLRDRIPKFVREGRLASVDEIYWNQPLSPNGVAFDPKRNQLLILSNSGTYVGCPGDPLCGHVPVKIFVFDLKTFRRIGLINVQLTIPGMLASGITYSPEDDRIYLSGEIQPGGLVSPDLVGNETIAVPRRPPAAIAAIDAATQQRAWVRLIPECDNPLAHQQVQMLIRRSPSRPILYFACVRTSIWPLTSSVMRLWIDPKGTQTDALSFPLEVFPISGSYVRGDGLAGVAAFDAATERFFLQSLAIRTPGAWVFDGRLSAWVGFITAPDEHNSYGGVQPQTGRFYMGGDTIPSYIVVSDARQTPVPQGTILRLKGQLYSPINVDPVTRRLFLNVYPGNNKPREWLVYEDQVAAEPPDEPVDYDGLTDDIPESSKTVTAFSGDVNGFAARVSLVGGTSGILSMCDGSAVTADCDPTDPNYQFASSTPERAPAPLSGATRELFLGRTNSVDVRSVGVAADAQSTSTDPTTEGEYQKRIQEYVSLQAGEDPNNPKRPIYDAMNWPWPQAFCLDSGGESASQTKPGQGGSSTVDCDLEKGKASATSAFSGFTSGAPQADLSIASGSFDATVTKNDVLGTITESTAIARGIHISIPRVGSLVIGRVTATAKTVAHGRSGSASVAWKRTIENVTLKNDAGDVVYTCTDGDSCDTRALVDAVNRTLQVRLKIRLPNPELLKTPKGAFATVEEPYSDYLVGLTTNEDGYRSVPAVEIVLYNDTSAKSRVVIQLAAIQASSIYGITMLPPDVLGEPPIALPPLAPILPPTQPNFPVPNLGGGGQVSTGGPGTNLVRTGLFLIRSPKEALLVGLTMLLIAGAFAAAWRRRTLIRSLGGL
jgi:hypothetical protein